MEKNSSSKIYGVLGNPAKHSLSPLMHNAAFKVLKINAEYKIFEKKPEEVEDFLHSLSQQNIYGLNVTVPYKEKVISFMDKLSLEARLIGAVNTIKVLNNKLEGFNTDGEGFLRHLSEVVKFNPQGKVIAIIGAGGAARAVCVSLSQKHPKAISIYDIDKPKAQALVEHLQNNFKEVDFQAADSIAGLNINKSGLLVNASPIGMKESDPCLVDKELLNSGLLVYDLIYNPAETELLRLAKEKGARTSNGLGMLLYQGARSFELWTGKNAPVEIMRKELTEGLKR
jgi:shikimate dehydrogenase